MHLTHLPAAAIVGLLAAHPSPSQDAQSDRTVAGGGSLPAGWRAQPGRDRPLGVATTGRAVQAPVAYAVDHTLDAPIGAFELHRR
jgi:hypothetical protein